MAEIISLLSDNACYLNAVKVLNIFAPFVDIPSRVPQGSLLGSFLFAGCKCEAYMDADHVTLIKPFSANQMSFATLGVLRFRFSSKVFS